MKEYYERNEAFKEYVNRYCESRNVSVDEALKHSVVREVANHYKSQEVQGYGRNKDM